MKTGRGRNRTGSLYRRWKGKKYSIDDSEAKGKGSIYLKYTVAGKVIEMSLKTPCIETAKKKQLEVMRPLELASETEALEQAELRLKRAQNEELAEWRKKNPPLKLADAWEEYLKAQNRSRPGPRTMAGYAADFRLFYEWISSSFPQLVLMKDVGVKHAEAYAEHLSARKLSPGSFNHHLNTLTMVWAVLAEKAQIQHNPFAWDRKKRRGLNRRSVKSEAYKRKKRPLTLDEVEKVLAVADDDHKTLILILACTGQRLVDGVKLKWSSIDFDQHLIRLRPQKTANRTGKEVFIPLLPQLEQELLRCERTGPYILPAIVERYEEYEPSASKSITALIKKAKIKTEKETDIDTYRAVTDVGAHSLRHTFVTIARMAGIPDPMICQITGHSSQEMVDHYTQFSEEMVASLAGKLIGETKAPSKALPFSETSNGQLPLWVEEKINKAQGLIALIDGKKNREIKRTLSNLFSEFDVKPSPNTQEEDAEGRTAVKKKNPRRKKQKPATKKKHS